MKKLTGLALCLTLAVLYASDRSSRAQPTQPERICSQFIWKHITTAADTQLIAANGATNIYVCDYEFSFNGTGNAFLEKSSTGTCGSPTQIGPTWYGVVNLGKIAANPFYRGMSTGASNQLCVNTSANVAFDIGVYFDQN